MLQFFQTRMGEQFFTSTVPRLVKALETIAHSYDSNLQKRIEVLELAINLPHRGKVECRDQFSFILGVREGNSNVYSVSFPTHRDSLIECYLDSTESEEAISYSSVPATVIAQLIINHGGLSA